MSETVPTLIITGPVGVGKTTVANEISEILTRYQMSHAFVDMDALRQSHPRQPEDPFNEALGLQNLAAIWQNFRATGAARLVLADIIESHDATRRYLSAIPGADVKVVRLKASLGTLRARVTRREIGSGHNWHLARSAELAELMEQAQIGEIVIETDGRQVSEVAHAILFESRWLDPSVPTSSQKIN